MPGAREIGGYPDIDEITRVREAEQSTLLREIGQNIALERANGLQAVNERTPKRINAAAHHPGARHHRALGEAGNSPVGQGRRSVPGRIRDLAQGDRADRRRLVRQSETKIEQIDIEPGISVEQEEPIVEPLTGLP